MIRLFLCTLLAITVTADSTTNTTSTSLPPVLMHYMPWFQWSRKYGWAGWHWKEKLDWKNVLLPDKRIASHYKPAIGPYNSVDRDVIQYHLKLMKAAGVKGIIVDWYGTRENVYDFKKPNLASSDAIIEEASKMGLLFTVCYEDWTLVAQRDVARGVEPTGDVLRDARKDLRTDLRYIRDNYANKPGFLREPTSAPTETDNERVHELVSASRYGSELSHENTSCLSQSKNYGDLRSPELCAMAAGEDGCGSFMFSSAYTVWGCRCCSSPNPNHTDHNLWAVYDVVDCDDHANKPGFLREPTSAPTENEHSTQGRPLMLIFGPRNIKDGTEWTSAMSEVFTDVNNRPKLLTIYGNAMHGDGTFSWFPPMKQDGFVDGKNTALKTVRDYLTNFYENKKGTLHVGSIFPGYKDYYMEGRGHESYGSLPEFDGKTFDTSMYEAQKYRPTFIQAATWNDWEEGTIIEPREGTGKDRYYFLLRLQQYILGYNNSAADFEAIFETYREKKGADFGWPV